MIRTILVVEDGELLRTALVRALEAADFELSAVSNGKEGLAAALTNHPDLIITDLLMPEMDGYAMLHALRQDEWGKQARVIILSGDDTNKSLNEALTAGVTVYFSKNEATTDELVKQISALA